MTTLAAKTLSAVCINKDVHHIIGEDEKLFGVYTPVYKFITDYQIRHKSVPSLDLVNESFPDAELESVDGTTAFYVTQLKHEYVQQRIQQIMDKAEEAMSTGMPAPKVLDIMQTSLSKLGKFTNSVRDLDITDAEAAEEYFDRLRQKADANEGSPGIATGFASIDSCYPTGLAAGHSVVVMGYAQPYSEPVLGEKGWTTMGELSVGESVIGSDGKPTEIIEIHEQGEREVYRVTFNDGTYVLCDKNHLWTVQTRKMRQNSSGFTVRSVSEMLEMQKYGRDYRKTMYKYYLPLPQPVVGDDEVTVGGYLMGQLLSDGCFTGTSVNITTNDSDAIDICVAENPDVSIVEVTSPFSTARQWRIMGGYENLGLSSMKGLHSHEKEIPAEYMTASVDVRYALLRGLMDGDGHCSSRRRPTFYTTSPRLADGIAELVRSLGGVASVRMDGRVYSSGGNGFVVTIWTPENPFGIERKAKNYTCRPWFKAIVSIEGAGYVERQRCIKVAAEDSLYLTTNYTLTHNTGRGKSMWSDVLTANIWNQGYKVMIVSLEMSPEEQRERLYAMMSNGLFRISDLSRGDINMDDFRTFSKDKLSDSSKLVVVSNHGHAEVTPNTIQAKIDIHRPDVVVLDYLQLFMDNAKTQAMTPRMLNLSREVKLLAMSNEIPIVSITAVTDEDGDKRDAPPTLKQVAWSRGIEYDANLAIAIHRPDDSDMVECVGRKNRHGNLFDFYFNVDWDHGQWEELFD